MIKTSKNSRANFKLIKIILTIAVGLVCYLQFKKLNLSELITISPTNYWSIFLLFLLVIPNYFFEYKKWILILKSIKDNSTSTIKIQSFFAGVITGMLTPNMQGNFIGRIYYFKKRQRLPISLLTLTANLGQFSVTVILGIIGLILSSNYGLKILLIPFLLSILSLLFYFNFEKIAYLKRKYKWYKHIQLVLVENNSFRLKVLWFSLLRNAVFSVQFLLALHAFGAEINLTTYWLIWQLYLWTTLSPSLILGKLFIRETLALWVFAAIALSDGAIIAASLTIWFINLLLPTLLGLFVCKKKEYV